MKSYSLLLLPFLLVSALGAQPINGPWLPMKKGMPRDVRKFIDRVDICDHFGGEDGMQRGDIEFIKKDIKKYGCDFLERDLKNLKKKYKNNSKVLSILNKIKDLPI